MGMFEDIASKVMGVFKTGDLTEEELETLRNAKPGEVIQVANPGSVDATLAQRGKRYGSFKANSIVYDELIKVFELSPNWHDAPPEVRHACGNIATKLARMLTGEVMYDDNWQDIAGFATLMAKICRGEAK